MRRMVVMGLGITGRAVTEALCTRGIDVVALDDRLTDDLRSWAQGLDVHVSAPDADDLVGVIRGADAVLPTPGLPDHHPIFAAAEAAGVQVRSEFDLAAAWDDRPVIAVTGTDGKTTVVTLIERMLDRSGIASAAVGNTEVPYVTAIDDPSTVAFVVEASSFRLGHSQQFSPRVAAWLNFGPDHLDAHRDLATYEQAKASIWAHLAPDALAIANRHDPVVMSHVPHGRARVSTFGPDAPDSDVDSGVVDDHLTVAGERLVAVAELRRALPHDVLNSLAAATAALDLGAAPAAIAEIIREFDGLRHRVEFVGEIDGVRYVNDSKATTPHAAAAALGSFDSVVLLAGGRNKGLAFDDLLVHADRVVHLVALGEAATDMQALFGDQVPSTPATSMPEAVDIASQVAKPGDVVLLSPACASFDWYRSYVHRGDDFTRIVAERMATASDKQGVQ